MMYDYLIVGAGLAGLAFAKKCLDNNKTFQIIDGNKQSAWQTAAGMYNPIVLKRFTAIWESDIQLKLAKEFYNSVSIQLDEQFRFPINIYRKFASIEEQNNWFLATDKPRVSAYLNTGIQHKKISHIETPFDYGEVFETGYVDVQSYVRHFQKYLLEKSLLSYTCCEYANLSYKNSIWSYKGSNYSNIIFAEGFEVNNNPFFNNLPLDGTKGELLIVKIPNLNLKKIVKSKIFIIPLINDLYKVGATYDWKTKDSEPSKDAKKELTESLEKLINIPYEVIEHRAGVRPTVKDRRPLVGVHYKNKQMYILNGLGTRGVLLAPFLSKALFNFIELNTPLDAEIDIQRYYNKLKKQNKLC